MQRRIPLAWLQLAAEKLRLAAAVGGITFAAVLMLMQLGFRDALLASATLVHDRLDADIVLVSPLYEFLIQPVSFPERRLTQALAVEGVESVAPLYVSLAKWRNPDSGRLLLVALLGFDVHRPTFTMAAVNQRLAALELADVVLADTASRPEIGPIEAWMASGAPLMAEVNERRVRVDGLFRVGTSFGINGMLITNHLNFGRLNAERSLDRIDVGLVKLASGADPIVVRDRLRARLTGDVLVMTRAEYAEMEQGYWLRASPIGFIFTLGTLMGLVVGAVIVYQILYSDVSDHLAEYATLKAMGFTNGMLIGVIFQQALILAVFGFVPGVVITSGLYSVTASQTNLPMGFTVERVVAVFVLTVVMCCGSGLLASRKLRAADPAEIF